ncbi:amino acid deaminase/aldolase [Agaribacter marinus]|uniref:Alanine racemase n=1 Tax=Virgibacillus salarius TaxID=447199 RepID=A0A941DWF8_9BACI|nr:alanine racemase [Virgibacillus salarius]MBR7796706.1 alanine racemase [Virgibacillus salarius]NAZ09416.1 amino acid deaminase/aldolase [Agaribacter marinus]
MFTKELLEREPHPGLVLDLAALDKNCDIISEKSNNKKVRIATKSIRSIPVIERILANSSVFQGLMCFSPKEALFLYEYGFRDILLGYPVWDASLLAKIAKINKSGGKIICMVDQREQIAFLQSIAKQYDGLIYTCLDIDMSTNFFGFHFGVRRSPLRDVTSVIEIAHVISKQSHLKLTGVMGYEAQLAGVPDQLPKQWVLNKAVTVLKKKSVAKIADRRKAIINALTNEGFSLEIVNGGGTGSLVTTSNERVVTEVTVGSGFYAPLLFDYYKQPIGTNPSLFFTLPIVRQPEQQIYTCLGGGYVASGSPGVDKLPQPVFPEGSKLISVEGTGEVQTPVFIPVPMHLGDYVVFRAAKAGEICERFTNIACITNGKVVDHYKTYRGEGMCFF